MKHTHIIEADSADEFAKEVASLHARVNGASTTAPAVTPVTTPAAPAKGKKSTKKPEAAPSESLPESEEETETEGAVPAETEESDPFGDDGADQSSPQKEITFEDIKHWGTKVNSEKGVNEARALLKKFGAQKPSEIKKDDYAKFVSECQKILKK